MLLPSPLIRLRHLLPRAAGEKDLDCNVTRCNSDQPSLDRCVFERPSPPLAGEKVAEGRMRGLASGEARP